MSLSKVGMVLVSLICLDAAAADAACLEGVGCTDSQKMSLQSLRQLSCDSLWTARNTIYYENGYCFQTERGRANFSNNGCVTSNQAAIRLNNYERTNVQAIQRVEHEDGCR